MRQLSPLDSGFLMIESPTTFGHVAGLIVVDPSTADAGTWDLHTVRALLAERLHLWPIFRQRLVEVPLGLNRPYWVDDPGFDLDFHVRELALPAPGSPEQLGEQVARLHARALDRRRPPWEVYVITGLADGRAAVYSKIHHAAIDGVSGAQMLASVLDIRPQPRRVEPEAAPFQPEPLPTGLDLVRHGLTSAVKDQVHLARTVPPALRHLGGLASGRPRAPRTPFNGRISGHRRFSFGSVSYDDVKTVRRRYGGTVNDIVMVLCTAALRRWLIKHDALPDVPLVAAVPVSVRRRGEAASAGNELSVMLAQLPTNLPDPEARIVAMRESMEHAKTRFESLPATLLRDLATLLPTAGQGLAARALFNLAAVPGPPFNLFVSHVPAPQVPLYLAGARVEGIHPVSAVTNTTGALNMTVFSYNRRLDFGLVACRDLVPDVWDLIGYLQDALAELVALSRGI
jgi:diacylglycerol O-acyltransferase